MKHTLLCFGGPLNEQVITTDRLPLLAPSRNRLSFALNDPPAITTPAIRTVRYDLERVSYQTWHGECLVAEDYPKHRITDALNTIAWMVAVLHGGEGER